MANKYRSRNLSLGILPSILNKKMDDDNIRKIIEPFIDEVGKILSEDVETELKVKFESFLPEALYQMSMNSDMHSGDESGMINQDNVNALLFTFLHWSCDLKGVSAEYFEEYS